MTQPLFYTIVSGGMTTFVNAAHVVKIEIETAPPKSGVIHLDSNSKIKLNANDADEIMRLMAFADDEQMQAINDFKKRTRR